MLQYSFQSPLYLFLGSCCKSASGSLRAAQLLRSISRRCSTAFPLELPTVRKLSSPNLNLLPFLALMPSVSSFGSAVSKPVHVQVLSRHPFGTRMIGRELYPTKADLSRKHTAGMMLVIARSPSATKLRTQYFLRLRTGSVPHA
jgi:hypothetical protein